MTANLLATITTLSGVGLLVFSCGLFVMTDRKHLPAGVKESAAYLAPTATLVGALFVIVAASIFGYPRARNTPLAFYFLVPGVILSAGGVGTFYRGGRWQLVCQAGFGSILVELLIYGFIAS